MNLISLVAADTVDQRHDVHEVTCMHMLNMKIDQRHDVHEVVYV